MARKGGGKSKSAGKTGSARGRAPAGGRGKIKRQEDSSQLLERGETPSRREVLDAEMESSGESSIDAGGYSTLGGGVYSGEGSEDDAPSYGDWQRHSTGGRPFEQRGADRRVAQRRRPDDALSRELHEILTKDPELDATEIEVQVEGGAVTLSGTVDSSDARLLAEELVESVTGVREVHNNLKVAR
jgi:BON domain